MNEKPKPFIKWVGGKRGIIEKLLNKIPKKINDYYEPFVGGGALFYELFNKVKKSYLSDLNIDLIIAYHTIKNNPTKLIEYLQEHQTNHNKNYYYKVRSLHEIDDPIQNSARFIYLLKTCFNGLFRVNKNGEFNTPLGNYKNPKILDLQNITLVNKALQKAEIKYMDFLKITPSAGDFVYFDPPYHPVNNSSFVQYISHGFNDENQTQLRDFALELTKKGVNVMISNSDTEFINSLYKENFKIEKIKAPRFVNCKADKRGEVFELLITNY